MNPLTPNQIDEALANRESEVRAFQRDVQREINNGSSIADRNQLENQTNSLLQLEKKQLKAGKKLYRSFRKASGAAESFIRSLKNDDGEIDHDLMAAKIETIKQSEYQHALLLIAAKEGNADYIRDMSDDHRQALSALESKSVKEQYDTTIKDIRKELDEERSKAHSATTKKEEIESEFQKMVRELQRSKEDLDYVKTEKDRKISGLDASIKLLQKEKESLEQNNTLLQKDKEEAVKSKDNMRISNRNLARDVNDTKTKVINRDKDVEILETKLNGLEEKFNTLKNDANNFQADNGELRSEVQNLESASKTAQGRIDTLTKEVEDQKTAAINKDKTYAEVTQRLQKGSDDQASQLQKLKSDAKDQDKRRVEEIKELQSQAKDKVEEVQRLEEQYRLQIGNLEGQKQGLENLKQTLEEQHQRQVNELKGEHLTLVDNLKVQHQQQVNELKSEHQRQLEDLDGKKRALESQKQELEDQNQALEDQKQELEDLQNAQKSRIQELENQKQELENQKQERGRKTQELQNEINNLQGQHQHKVKELDGEKRGLEDKIQTLKGQASDVEKDLSTLREQKRQVDERVLLEVTNTENWRGQHQVKVTENEQLQLTADTRGIRIRELEDQDRQKTEDITSLQGKVNDLKDQARKKDSAIETGQTEKRNLEESVAQEKRLLQATISTWELNLARNFAMRSGFDDPTRLDRWIPFARAFTEMDPSPVSIPHQDLHARRLLLTWTAERDQENYVPAEVCPSRVGVLDAAGRLYAQALDGNVDEKSLCILGSLVERLAQDKLAPIQPVLLALEEYLKLEVDVPRAEAPTQLFFLGLWQTALFVVGWPSVAKAQDILDRFNQRLEGAPIMELTAFMMKADDAEAKIHEGATSGIYLHCQSQGFSFVTLPQVSEWLFMIHLTDGSIRMIHRTRLVLDDDLEGSRFIPPISGQGISIPMVEEDSIRWCMDNFRVGDFS